MLNDTEKGILATSLMGGNQARCEISKYNEDVDKTCNYCKEVESTADHIKWVCKEFKEVRSSIDDELARVPPDFLTYNVRCGIAPAMETDGETTFWGKQLPEDTDEQIKKLLGINMELHTPGKDQQSTDDRNLALEILAEHGHKRLNARQLLLKIKQAPGSGVDLVFPTRAQIQEEMEGHGEDVQVRIYGDGSVTSPTKWWAALGGYGVWMPAWNENNQRNPKREEASYHGQAIGQTLTSTRLELIAWVRVLALPIRSCYATDSASMMGKAIKLIKAVEEREKQIEQGKRSVQRIPSERHGGFKLTVTCGNKRGWLLSKEVQEINRLERSRGMPPPKTSDKASATKRTREAMTKATNWLTTGSKAYKGEAL